MCFFASIPVLDFRMSENKQDAARKKQAREGDLMHNMLTKGATLELEVNSKAGEWKRKRLLRLFDP